MDICENLDDIIGTMQQQQYHQQYSSECKTLAINQICQRFSQIKLSDEQRDKIEKSSEGKQRVFTNSSNQKDCVRQMKQRIEDSRESNHLKLDFSASPETKYDFLILSTLASALITDSSRTLLLRRLTLNLRNVGWTDTQLNWFCTVLPRLHELQELDLNLAENEITDEGVTSIEHMLIEEESIINCNLFDLSEITLNLDRNPLQQKGLSLLRILNSQKRKIRVFRLSIKEISQTFLDPKSLIKLLRTFKSYESFIHLESFHISLGFNSISAIFPFAQQTNSEEFQDKSTQQQQQQKQIQSSISSNPNKFSFVQNGASNMINNPIKQVLQKQKTVTFSIETKAGTDFQEKNNSNLIKLSDKIPLLFSDNLLSDTSLNHKTEQNLMITSEKQSEALCLLLKLMLKYTENLKDFCLEYNPIKHSSQNTKLNRSNSDQIFNNLVWKSFGDLLKKKSHSSMESFKLSVPPFAGNSEFDYFLYRLGSIATLTSLRLDFSEFPYYNQNITTTHLSRFLAIPASGMSVNSLPLTQLHLSLRGISIESANPILIDLSYLLLKLENNLTHISLDLSCSSFDDSHATSLIHALAAVISNENLVNLSLDFSACARITDESVNGIARLLSHPDCNLNALQLDFTKCTQLTNQSTNNLLDSIASLRHTLVSLKLAISDANPEKMQQQQQQQQQRISKSIRDKITTSIAQELKSLTTWEVKIISRDTGIEFVDALLSLIKESVNAKRQLLRQCQMIKRGQQRHLVCRKFNNQLVSELLDFFSSRKYIPTILPFSNSSCLSP